MVYRGHVKNGRVELDEPATLPEGAPVEVSVTRSSPVREGGDDDANIPTLYERLKPIIGIAKGLPPDLAKNHDHYLHGSPKRT